MTIVMDDEWEIVEDPPQQRIVELQLAEAAKPGAPPMYSVLDPDVRLTSFNPKQIRARARRAKSKGVVDTNAMQLLYKPVEEWDAEELARGRPRDINGRFGGRIPHWVTREVYEQAQRRFIEVTKEGVQVHGIVGMAFLGTLLQNNDVDDDGKPIVPISVKADVAKWMVEHTIGKPTKHVEHSGTVQFEHMLAEVMAEPGQLPALNQREREIQAQLEAGTLIEAEEVD